MSDETHNRDSAGLPKITVVVNHKHEMVEQDYDNAEIRRENGNVSSPLLFNSYAENRDIVLFMGEYNLFNSSNALSRAAKIFSKYHLVSIVYSDELIDTGDYIAPLYYPQVFQSPRMIINGPIFYKPLKDQQRESFNEQVQSLYFHELIVKASQQALMFHIAEPLFKRLHDPNLEHVKNDLEIIQKCTQPNEA